MTDARREPRVFRPRAGIDSEDLRTNAIRYYCIIWGGKRRQETFRILVMNIPSILSVLDGGINAGHNLKVQVSPECQ
jgi:hypothetical protein